MTLKTLHGSFEFRLQKYLFDGVSVNYLDFATSEPFSYISQGLQEFCAYYSNQMSYEEVARLVERQCGSREMSAQSIWQLVQQQAMVLSETIESETLRQLEEPVELELMPHLNVYDEQQAEVLLFDDAIGVKAQKAARVRSTAPSPVEPTADSVQRVFTDVVLLQTASQQFEYLSVPIYADGRVRLPIETVVQARVQQVYGARPDPLPLVVISDGASSIRARWKRTFGSAVVFLLDWYHLSAKLRQLMSMIAHSKTEKSAHLKVLLVHLWHGQTQAALEYLHQLTPRNREKWQELIVYLDKHQHEIIDYERRRQAGKAIGSGRVEKAVDQVIGFRQKHKGKSWRPQGSRALALLKVLHLNGNWQQFWFPKIAIA